jgi:hypothetical protein
MPIKITNDGSVVYKPKYIGPKQYKDQFTGRMFKTADSGVVAPYERTGIGTGGSEAPNPVAIATRLQSATLDGKTLIATNGSNATLKSVNCLTFDGDNDHVDLVGAPQEIFSAGVFEIETDILIDDSDTGIQKIFQFNIGGSGYFQVQKNNGSNSYQVWCRNSSANNIFLEDTITFTPDTLFNLKITGNGTNVIVKHDDSTVATISITTANFEASVTYAEPSLGDASFSLKGQMANFKMSAGASNTLHTQLTLQEGTGVTAHDMSGNGNHATIDGCTHTTLNGLASHNHRHGFNDDIFLGYKGYWDSTASGSGTFTINEDNITLAGNSGVSGKVRQHVFGLVSGDTLVITGTVVQTGGSGGGSDVAISSASAGFAEGSVFLGGAVGTYTFTKTFNANSSTCDIQLVAVNGANFTISDLKFTVVKKIPSLPNRTIQVGKFDGTADEIDTGYHPSDGDLVIEATVKADSVTNERNLHSVNGNLGYFFRINNGEWQLYVNNAYIFSTSTQKPAVGQIFDTRLEFTASTNTWVAKSRVRGTVSQEFTTLGTGSRAPNFGSANFLLGQKASTQYFDGEYHSFKVTDAGVSKVHYDFHRDDDNGKSTITDRSGTGNDGTISVGSGGLNSFWGIRVTPDSLTDSISAVGTIVNANYRTGSIQVTDPVNSNTIHNNSECSISFNSKTLGASSLSDFKNNVEPSLSGVWLNKTSDGFITELVEYSNYTIATSGATSAVNAKYFDGREI